MVFLCVAQASGLAAGLKALLAGCLQRCGGLSKVIWTVLTAAVRSALLREHIFLLADWTLPGSIVPSYMGHSTVFVWGSSSLHQRLRRSNITHRLLSTMPCRQLGAVLAGVLRRSKEELGV